MPHFAFIEENIRQNAYVDVMRHKEIGRKI
jgi:hypothetical protein